MPVSLNQQIDEIDRELKMRAEVYPQWIRSGNIRQSVADFQVARMKAVKATLEWLRDNEADVRAYVVTKVEARKKGEAA